MSSLIDVKYYIETYEELGKAADMIAKMQSTGTWKDLGDETAKIVERHGAKVKRVVKTGEKDKYELPTRAEKGKKVNCGNVVISYPFENFGHKISMLLTTVAGEVFDMEELTAVKVTDMDFPDEFLSGFSGPAFGDKGTRNIVDGHERVLFGAITKPCVGLTPKEIAKLAYEVSRAGADFIKDDELLADAPYNRVKDRVVAVTEALDRAYQETGKKTMYAFNITDDPDVVMDLHDIVVEYGGKGVMFNVLTGGFNTLNKLSKHTQVPIHCHRDFAVSTFRSQYMGITSALFTKLTRLCGGDQIQCGGMDGYIYETDEDILKSMQECSTQMGNMKPVLNVSSGGQWAGKLPVNIRKIGNTDFMYLCGGGVFGHPNGGYAGMKSLIAAYEAYKQGIKLEDYDNEHLQSAIKHFGKVLY